jgi:hypothetical protein
MGFSAQAGHVIVRTQPTPGVFAPDIATMGVAVKLKTGALGTNRELLIPDAEIGGTRDVVDAYLGTINNSGDYEFYVRLESLSTWLQAAIGAPVQVTATGVTTNTFTPSDAAQLPFLSIEEQVGNVFDTFQYTDAVVNTLHLEAEANGYLQGTVGIIAKTRVAGATPTPTPLYDSSPLLVGTNIIATYNGVQLPAKSFTFDINNNFEDSDFRLGSFFLNDLTPKRREVTASFAIREIDKNLWRQSVLGAASATAPTGLATKQQLVITANTYEFASGAITGSLTITIPKFVFRPYNLTASGDDVLESTIEGQGLRPSPGTPLMTVVVRSADTTIA